MNLDDILEPGEPKLVASGFEFTEGPLWHPGGQLYVSDVDAGIHYVIGLAGGGRTVVRAESGGANGATFAADGGLVMCDQDARRVVRVDDDGSFEVIADSYGGRRLNRCNDIVARSNGDLYFTDPQGLMEESERALGHSAIFRVPAAGGLYLTASDMSHPNGLAFSPDESLLYVSNTRPDPHIQVYDVKSDGTLSGSRLFAEMPYVPAGPGETFRAHSGAIRPAAERGGVPDGMKVDQEGRVFCTGPGGVWVFAPGGERLRLIELPELPANVAFGDADLRTLFVAARTSVYSLRVRIPGVPVRGAALAG